MARSDEFPPLACCVTPMLIALYLKYYQTRERYGKYRAFMKGKAVAQLCNQLKEQHGGSSTPLLNMSTTRDGQGVWSTGWTQHGLDREQSLSRGHWMRLYASRPEPFRTPKPPSQYLMAGRFMPYGNRLDPAFLPN